MPPLSYKKRGLILARKESTATGRQVRDLQRDLRRLGYLREGIDGRYGPVTELAVKALQHDLLRNDGRGAGGDGEAPVRVLDYNRGRVVRVDGVVDPGLAGCISDMLNDPDFPVLPNCQNPREENARIRDLIRDLPSSRVPIPFLMAVLKQESGLRHFHEPSGDDEDTYIVVGLDTNARERFIITSRGYGAGQYTLFHHPPRGEEVGDFMLDVGKNLEKAAKELRYKFDYFVSGPTPGTRADDRIAEYGSGDLRLCKYSPGDGRHWRDCPRCMDEAGQADIREGVTPLYRGSAHKFAPTQYYRRASYSSVPVRGKVGCDWPYAVRRYNGSGLNSYHYQAIVLKNVAAL